MGRLGFRIEIVTATLVAMTAAVGIAHAHQVRALSETVGAQALPASIEMQGQTLLAPFRSFEKGLGSPTHPSDPQPSSAPPASGVTSYSPLARFVVERALGIGSSTQAGDPEATDARQFLPVMVAIAVPDSGRTLALLGLGVLGLGVLRQRLRG